MLRLTSYTALVFSAPAFLTAAELQHFWDFESAAAPYRDAATGVHGTVEEPPTLTIVEGRAPGTKALHTLASVSGAPDFVFLPGNGPAMFSLGSGAFSMSLWFRMAEDTGNNRGIVDFSGNGGDGMQMLLTAANSLNFRVDGSGAYNVVAMIPSAPVEDNAWHFFAAVYDPALTADTLKVYLDGAAVSASVSRGTTAATTVTLNANCWLGTFNFANLTETKGLDGDLDDVAYYSGKLSEAQISALHAGTLQPGQIASPLPALSLARQASGTVDLTWPSAAENSYSVWESSDLNTWTPLTQTPLQGTGATLTFQTSSTTPATFYRVRRF